jgi:hypothetical protein
MFLGPTGIHQGLADGEVEVSGVGTRRSDVLDYDHSGTSFCRRAWTGPGSALVWLSTISGLRAAKSRALFFSNKQGFSK